MCKIWTLIQTERADIDRDKILLYITQYIKGTAKCDTCKFVKIVSN